MSNNWHYAKGGEKRVPITAAQLKELATSGQLAQDDLVWREDMKEWRKASTVKGLFPEQTAMSPPPPKADKHDAAQESVPLWERPMILVLLVTCCFPVGLFLMWRSSRIATKYKVAATATLVGLMMIGFIFPDPPQAQRAESDDPDGFANIQSGKKRDGSERNNTPPATAQTKPVEIGTLEEMGEKAFHNLPFADVEDSPDAGPIALTEEFAMSGTFRFRDILHDTIKATLTAEEIRVLNYKEKDKVREFTKTFDITEGTGNPKVMVEHHRNDHVPLHYPIIRVGATPGEEWECVNLDISGNSMIDRFRYLRCVDHNGTRCAEIERSFMTPDGKQSTKTVEWYAQGIGLIMKVDFLPSHHLGLGWQLLSTDHRIINK